MFKNSFRSHFNLNNNDFILGMVARYDVQKDHKTLLEAFQSVKIKAIYLNVF